VWIVRAVLAEAFAARGRPLRTGFLPFVDRVVLVRRVPERTVDATSSSLGCGGKGLGSEIGQGLDAPGKSKNRTVRSR
jgi:hypothetical protein